MNKSININPQDLEIVRAILRKYTPADAKIWVFGSRANGTTKPSSDLDIALDYGRKMTKDESNNLYFAFEDSPLPYRVDCIDIKATNPEFLLAIERDKVAMSVDGGNGQA